MKAQNSPKISVIIPCFNEEQNIKQCLDAVFAQTDPVYEVIVVDNNCSDKTVEVASAFKKVKVVSEPKQGLINARNAGFNVAKGDILARIDVDSRPAKNWSSVIAQSFSDDKVQAVTGTGYFYDAPFKVPVRLFRNFVAVHLNKLILGHNMLWGSNMAIKNQCWQNIEKLCCNRPNIMEDLDIAGHIFEEYGAEATKYQPSMRADISARRAMSGLKSNYLYLKMWPDTLSHHGYPGAKLSWPIIIVVLAMGIPAALIMRFYDQDKQRLILRRSQWRTNNVIERPNP